MTYNVQMFQDSTGDFHYRVYTPGRRVGVATACGLDPQLMRESAAFPIGDTRGRVHFERGCDTCIEYLTVLFDSVEGSS